MSSETYYPTGQAETPDLAGALPPDLGEPAVSPAPAPPNRLSFLFNQENNQPSVVIQKENARHRRILFMKAHGMSNRAIAEALEMSPVSVGIIVRQEWFKSALVQLMNESGIDGVRKVLQGAALDSVFKIVELRDKASSEAVQRDCAFDILDRYLGKAVQPIGESGVKPPADEARLDSEILELQRKLGHTQRNN